MSSPPPETAPASEAAPASAPARPAPMPLTLRQGAAVLAPHLREQRSTIVVAVLLSLVAAASSLAQPLLVGRVISTVSDGSGLGVVVLAVVAVLVAGTVVGAVQQYLLQRAGEGVVLGVRRRLVDRLLRITVAERDARLSGDLLSRVGSDTTALASVVSSGIFDVVSVALTAIGALVLMGVIDLPLLGVTVLAVGTGTVVGVTMSRRLAPLDLATQQRVGAMSAAVARVLSAVRTVRASGATERELVGVVTAAEDARRVAVHAARVRATISPVTGIAVQGAFVAVLGLGGYRVASGDVSVAQLVSFILLLFTLVFPLGQLLRVWSVLQTGLAALTRIEEVLVLEVEDDADPAPAGAAAPASVPARSIVRPRAVPAGSSAAGTSAAEPPALELDRVGFSYADGTTALRDVSFAVPCGTRTALVGPSGGGKSTVLSLVERFYDPTSGVVRLGGTDVRDMPRAGLRARLGYVEQDAPVLAGTLRSNLLLAAPAATETALAQVLESVGLTEIGTRSAEGLDVQVGESGVLLSGGQRQRLAIARSLLAEPELLLLDEPTASLDARNEALLRDALAVAAASRTLVVVAHRLSTVVDSDQIVVIEAGRVRAAGRHAELLEVDALYRELATTQLLV